MARPLTPIDAEQVYKLAKLGCTQEEIGEFFGVSQTVISTRFAMEYSRARADWKQSLRRAQTIRALRDRSDNMLIHLGKTYLGQVDKLQVTTREVPKWIDRANNPRDKQHEPTNGHTNGSGLAP